MWNSALSRLHTLTFPALVAALCILAALGGAEAQSLLRFQRDALAQGEVWRLATAHFVHLGWPHLWLNLAGLALIWLLVGRVLSFRGWSLVFFFAALGTSGGLWLLQPDLDWYVGLSGVLHGLLVAGALAGLRGYKDAPLLLALVAVKLAWEQWMGPMPGSEQAAGGPVVVSAHLYGALSGAAVVGLAWLSQRVRAARRIGG